MVGTNPTPTVSPELVAQEVIGIVKNELADRKFSAGKREIACLSTLSYEGFLANYAGNGQWEVETLGGYKWTRGDGYFLTEVPMVWRWRYSERTERVTWASEAHRSECDF